MRGIIRPTAISRCAIHGRLRKAGRRALGRRVVEREAGFLEGDRSLSSTDRAYGAPLGENGSVARLPAHAHQARLVYAYKTDLDAWLRSRRTEPGEPGASPGDGATQGRQGRLAWLGAFVGASAIALAAFWQHASTETPLAEPFKITPLTSLTGFERYSSFSPDGSHVAFSWRNDSGAPFHIHTKAIESGSTVQRTSDHVDDLSPAWSPDGRFIAFLRSLSGEQAQLVLIPASGGPERELMVISRRRAHLLP